MNLINKKTSPPLGPTPPPTPFSLTSGQALLLSACLLWHTPLAANTGETSASDLAWRYHCITCHRNAGVANSDRYPNLSGQNALYLETRLKAFRAKEDPRNSMNAQAAGLTDEEIKRLAGYFSQGGREVGP